MVPESMETIREPLYKGLSRASLSNSPGGLVTDFTVIRTHRDRTMYLALVVLLGVASQGYGKFNLYVCEVIYM